MSLKLQLKKSNKTFNNKAVKPTPQSLDYGEVAINYATGSESIFLKNDSNQIVTLPVGEKEDWAAVNITTTTSADSNGFYDVELPAASNIVLNIDTNLDCKPIWMKQEQWGYKNIFIRQLQDGFQGVKSYGVVDIVLGNDRTFGNTYDISRVAVKNGACQTDTTHIVASISSERTGVYTNMNCMLPDTYINKLASDDYVLDVILYTTSGSTGEYFICSANDLNSHNPHDVGKTLSVVGIKLMDKRFDSSNTAFDNTNGIMMGVTSYTGTTYSWNRLQEYRLIPTRVDNDDYAHNGAPVFLYENETAPLRYHQQYLVLPSSATTATVKVNPYTELVINDKFIAANIYGNDAVNDYDGYANTQTLLAINTQSNAGPLNNILTLTSKFPNTQWYLPSLGEALYMGALSKAIQNTLTKIHYWESDATATISIGAPFITSTKVVGGYSTITPLDNHSGQHTYASIDTITEPTNQRMVFFSTIPTLS